MPPGGQMVVDFGPDRAIVPGAMRSIFAVKSSFLVALGWVVVPLLLIGWSADLTFGRRTRSIDSQGAVTHAIDVRQRARSVYISLVDAETGRADTCSHLHEAPTTSPTTGRSRGSRTWSRACRR